MSRFFINRPIVAMVIAIITVIVGLVTMLGLPIAQFPKIIPPEIFLQANYVGADAQTIEESVATPIEQQMSGVDNMNYMYSLNANNGLMRMYVNFDVKTDPNTDHMLTQLRYAQAESQLPADVRNYGVTVQKSLTSPFLFIALFSPDGAYDSQFLANYAYINLNDALTRVPGIASVTVFGAGQYVMRLWVKPDQLAKLNITVPEIISAVSAQNAVNPAGRIGGRPVPPGQEFTYSVRAQGRLQSEQEFGEIVLRANPDGSIVRLRDVARMELGAQDYDIIGRLNGKPAAILALFQLPGSNALEAANGAKKRMAELKQRFPSGLDYVISLDTTKSVTEGMREIVKTLGEALVLVMLVVFIFLQGWRATLIPMLAVPVSLIGTFAVFPLLGFSINTLSLFGLVLAVGLVVDDAIVVVEAVERHIEEGLSAKEAAFKAMQEVSGPVVAIAIILAAVFVPTVFIPGALEQGALAIASSKHVCVRAFDRSVPRIMAYGSELNQVWTNLIDNAIHAVSGAGKICIGTSLEDNQLVVEIVDNGAGIPPEVQSHMFELFFTTKSVGTGTGTGLGLIISNRIVGDRHGGEIEFESRPGETRFKVRLPVNRKEFFTPHREH